MASSAPRGLPRLLSDFSAYRWAFDRVLHHLAPADVERLVIAALEHGDDRLDELSRWLLDGDAPCAPLSNHGCLNQALLLGCWRAAEILSLRVQESENRAINWKVLPDAVRNADSALRRVMAAVTQSEFLFDRDVLVAVAARGDCDAMHCILVHEVARGLSGSGLVRVKQALCRAAIDARQFHIADWLATQAYAPGDDATDACKGPVKYYANQLARDGDLDALQNFHAQRGLRAWDPDAAAAQAAENGHIEVLQWISAMCEYPLSPLLWRHAVRRGELAFLEWLWEAPDMPRPRMNIIKEAASSGRLDVLRWLLLRLNEATWEKDEDAAFVAAVQACELEVVRFFHEERGLHLDASFLLPLKASASVESIEYVLDRCTLSVADAKRLLNAAATYSTLEIVECLVSRGHWSRTAFRRAMSRGRGLWLDGDQSSHSFKICRFLYAQAKQRARELVTRLDAQIDIRCRDIRSLGGRKNVETARWLAECVPEISMCWDPPDHPFFRFPHSPAGQAVIVACLRARPDECHKIQWLPLWAVRANSFEAFSMLIDMAHPNATAPRVFSAVTVLTRDPRFMLKLLAANGVPKHEMQSAVAWAARIGAEEVLHAIAHRWDDAVQALE